MVCQAAIIWGTKPDGDRPDDAQLVQERRRHAQETGLIDGHVVSGEGQQQGHNLETTGKPVEQGLPRDRAADHRPGGRQAEEHQVPVV